MAKSTTAVPLVCGCCGVTYELVTHHRPHCSNQELNLSDAKRIMAMMDKQDYTKLTPEQKAMWANDPVAAGKQTNPKDLVGSKKTPLSTLPWRVLWRVGLAMLEGMVKYGRHNYRVAGVRNSVYFDSTMRHIGAWWEGQDIDPDSGFHHLDKALAGLMVLRDAQLNGKCTDDRPPSVQEDMSALDAEAKRIVEKHEDKKPHHWTIGDGTA